MASLLLIGCGHSKKQDEERKKGDKPDMAQSAEFGNGDTTVYESSAPSSLASFTVVWKKGSLQASKAGIETGHLTGVSGDLFSKGKVSSHYRSNEGDAVKEDKRLTMTGNVVLVTVDGKQTLRAPQAEYHGDHGFVRAMGGVTADGPFGTLSGVPELWATPDLHTIGTPDTVSQMLKIPLLAVLAATTTPASPVLQSKDYTLSNFTSPLLQVLPDGQRATLHPKPGAGPILLEILSRGIKIRATSTVVLDFTSKNIEVKHMVTEGPVNVVQTAQDGSTVTVDGTRAEYDWKPGAKTATLEIGGKVTIVQKVTVKDSKGKPFLQVTTTKGDKGNVLLADKPAQGEDGLKKAVLAGHVTIDIDAADGQTVNSRSDQMTYTPNGETAGIEATGHVVITDITNGTDSAGKPTNRKVVTTGASGNATILSKPASGANPLQDALLTKNVSIDVTGSNEQTFHGTGDRLEYKSEGEGGRAVMTGDLEFTGDTPLAGGKISDANTAIMTIGKKGWEEIEMTNSDGKTLGGKIQSKEPPKPAADKKAPPKKKKGGPL